MTTEDSATVISPEAEPKLSAPMRTPKHGFGQLQTGNPKATGRPKKDIRNEALQGSEASIKWAKQVLANDQIPDTDASKAKAADILLRYGLGTKDEVEIADKEAVLKSIAKAMVRAGISIEVAEAVVVDAAQDLGIG